MNRPLTGLLAAAALSAGLTATRIQTEDAPGNRQRTTPPSCRVSRKGPAERKEFTKEEIKAALLQAATSAAKKGNAANVQVNFGAQ